MSQHSATRSAPARRTRRAAQILRHTAVVGAGMASIGLTVAAGTYIVHEMAGAQRPDASLAAPPAPNRPTWNTGTPGELPTYRALAPIAENIGLASVFTTLHDLPRESTVVVTGLPTSPEAAQQSSNSPGLAGRVRVGNAYLGAQVVPVQRNSLSITLDTNMVGTAFDIVLPTGARERLGIGPAGNTQLHTEFDTKRGEVTVVVSDTALGKVDVRVARHPAPARTEPAQAADQSTVHETTTTPVAEEPAPECVIEPEQAAVPEHSATGGDSTSVRDEIVTAIADAAVASERAESNPRIAPPRLPLDRHAAPHDLGDTTAV
ncbi:hypothetical protein [Nocardia sp. NPDC050406]|uniref:hypothetical protein n=1 Tax=Nocardia sp. NPDC050406 TaxID=3364318 RepID=UPI0037AA6AA0